MKRYFLSLFLLLLQITNYNKSRCLQILNLAGKTISEVDSEIKISVAKPKISVDN